MRTGRTPACNLSAASRTGRRFARRSIRLGGGQDDFTNIQNAINKCPAGEVVQLGAGTFTISMSEYINLDRGITLRGSGTCTNSSSPYCPTVINVHDGLLAWTGGQCGTSTSSEEACASNPAIQVEPAAMVNLLRLWLVFMRSPNGSQHVLRRRRPRCRRGTGTDDDSGQQDVLLFRRNVGADRRGVRRGMAERPGRPQPLWSGLGFVGLA